MSSRSSFHQIRRVSVTGGFLDGLCIDFDQNLNCIIGGRGTGKTTVLEILRWTLGQMPSREDFSSRYRRIEKILQANLKSGHVDVEIETCEGLQYLVRRSPGEAPLVLSEQGEPIDIDIGRGAIFSAEFYSQNQIEEIANDPLFQLKLIDKFVSKEVEEVGAQIEQRVRELRANASQVSHLRDSVRTLKERVSLLPEVTERLKAYKVDEEDAEATELRTASGQKALRDRERRAAERLQGVFRGVSEQLAEVAAGLPLALVDLVDQAILGGVNGPLFQRIDDLAVGSANEIQKRLEEAIASAEATVNELKSGSEELSVLHLAQERAYQEHLALHEKGKDQATERDKLLRQQAELLEQQKKLVGRRAELEATESERIALLRRLSDLKDSRFDFRTRVAATLTSQLAPSIRVRIEQHGNTVAYRDLLLSAMKGSGFRYTQIVDRVVERIPPHELAATVQRGDSQALADNLELDSDRANRLLLHLKDQPAVFEIEVVDLYDRPTIQLKDGLDYKDSTALSTGQKCTTILPILLLESESPLLIDQPEDNLDNAYIYEAVVKSVRGVRGRRQLIFVTHNPNLPVLGEAQRVVVLQSTGRRASVKAVGTVDEVKGEVETILEGGREAFQKRKERYGY